MKDLRVAPRPPCRRRASGANPAHVTTLVCAVAFDALVIVAASVLGLSLPVVLAVAVATVLAVALATQRSLRSALAGLTLLVARPYSPGERLRLFWPQECTTVDVELVRVGLVNTTLGTGEGLLVVPNTLLLRHPPECRD